MLALDIRNPEEVANTLTHGAGTLAAAVGGATLVTMVAASGDRIRLVSALVYSVSLVALYAASTLYHWEQEQRTKTRLELLDHCAIFVLIAGTYTPFLLISLGKSVGPTMMWLVWSLAIAGVVFKLAFGTRFRIASTLLYIAMGWLIVLVAGPMIAALPLLSLALLVAGGLAYTAGTYFFCNERIPYCHAIWHLFVLAGSACHFAAIAMQLLQ
jgi:hemolysin III